MKTQKIRLTEHDALIMVDVQNDFCPFEKSALKVAEGDRVVPVLNRLRVRFEKKKRVPTRDWHLEKTKHFAKWPPHCMQGTWGAEFHKDLVLDEAGVIVSKGMGTEDDGYSGFEGETQEGQSLEEYLRSLGVKRLIVGGLATDYCVKETVLSALKVGKKKVEGEKFEVVVVLDAIRAVNYPEPNRGELALKEMEGAGAAFTTSDQIH